MSLRTKPYCNNIAIQRTTLNVKIMKSIKGVAILATLLLSSFSIFTTSSSAQVRGISYSITPTGQYMLWHPNSGLDKGYMYGGQVGFGFGRFVELSGIYTISNDVETNLGDIEYLPSSLSTALSSLPSRSVDLTRMGGSMKFNLGSGSFYPYLTAGTGILRFEPDDRETSEQIYLSGGAGLSFQIDSRFSLNIGAENMWYRYNPGSMFIHDSDRTRLDLLIGDIPDKEVGNWAVTAGLTAYLGGRNPNTMSDLDRDLQKQFSGGFSGVSLIVEPMVGVIQFNDKLAYRKDQRVAGVNAGFDFGQYVGLRGFYWRGLEEDEWTQFDKFAMYGGEMKFKLNDASSGIVPFINIGAGYIDVNNQYEGRRLGSEDQPFATAGGGIELRLSDNFNLFGSARALLVSEEDVEDITSTDNIFNSWMFSAGMSFALGGKKETSVVRSSEVDRRMSTQRVEAETELERVRDEARLRELYLTEELLKAYEKGDSVAVARIEKERNDARMVREVYQSSGDISNKTITLPVLEDGEIYIRFGKTGTMNVSTKAEMPDKHPAPPATHYLSGYGTPALSPDIMRDIIRSVLFETLHDLGISGQGMNYNNQRVIEQRVDTVKIKTVEKESSPQKEQSEIDEAAIEKRILEKLERDEKDDEMLVALQKQINDLSNQIKNMAMTGQAQQPATSTTSTTGTTSTGTTTSVSTTDDGTIERMNLNGVSVVSGFNLAKKPFQMILGVRADYGEVFGGRFRLAPDANLGFFNTTSYNINVNLLRDIRVDDLAPWSPYVGFGVGLLGFSNPPNDVKGVQGVLNLIVGAEKPLNDKNSFYFEYQNMNLFKFNRIQAGYRFKFGDK
jgi:hypothetical protein